MSGATPFIYLLNRMENAASAKDPSKAGYGGHRKAVLDHVAKAESDLAEALAVLSAFDQAWKDTEPDHMPNLRSPLFDAMNKNRLFLAKHAKGS